MRKNKTGKKSAAVAPADFERVRRLALALPGVEEGTYYGTPAFRVGRKYFTRLHDKLDCLVIRIEPSDRQPRMAADPEAFFITDHYLNAPWMLIRLDKVADADLKELLEDAWRLEGGQRQTRAGTA
jgi:hypothetical protein